MNETTIQSEIMLALSKHGCKIFRRNTGLFYAKRGNTYTPIRIGVPGQADLSGHTPTGRAFYLECKTPDELKSLKSRIARNKITKHDKDQINFIEQMKNSNALASFISSTADALELLELQ